MCRGSCCKWK